MIRKGEGSANVSIFFSPLDEGALSLIFCCWFVLFLSLLLLPFFFGGGGVGG